MSAFKLSAAAAEFRPPTNTTSKHTATSTSLPSTPASSLQAQQQAAVAQVQQQAGEQGWGEEDEYEDGYEEGCGYYDEAGDWVSYQLPDDCWDQHTDTVTAAAAAAAASSDHHQQQQQQQAMAADDAVVLLHSCYPNHARALLLQLLEACDGDVQQAARILNDMDFEQRRARIAAAAAVGPGLYSSSSSGTSSTRSSGPASKKQQDFSYSLEQFPALGGGSNNSSSTTRQQGSGSSRGSSNWAAVTSKLPAATPAAAATATVPSQAHKGGSSSSKGPSGTYVSLQSAAGSSKDSEAVPWVETGTAVSQQYAAAREEASDHARLRNQCFQQATVAFLAGDKALAKELSAKGKAAAEAMWAAHERASSQIYQQRNTRLQAQAASKGSSAAAAAVIDLHGLHVQEVMQVLPQHLAALAAAQQHEAASVIVGVGKHAKGPAGGRMGQAVAALLKELGYSYREPQPGLLRVRLR